MSIQPSPSAPPADDQSTSPLEYVQALWKRRWVIILVAAMGCLGSYAWTLKQPRIYQADCTLQYDPNPPRPLGEEVSDPTDPGMFWETRVFFATQNRIIGSRAVAEKVVAKLSLHKNPDFWNVPAENRARWKGKTVAATAQRLQALTTVTQERDTRIVHVMVEDRDPERAQLLANTLVDTYIEKTMADRLSATTSALEWLGSQLDTLKTQLEHSELALHEFTGRHRELAVSLDDQQNIVTNNIEQLSSALNIAKTKRIELAARLEQLKLANSEDPMRVNASTVLHNEAIQRLRTRFRELATEREGLIVNYGDKHPKIQAVDSQIAIINQQIRDEIDDLIASAQTDLNEAAQIEAGIQEALDRANRLGIELNRQEITYRRLQRERDNTSNLYGTLLERTAQTDLTRALSMSFVRVVDAALPPVFPISPRMHINLIVGLVAGLLLGIGLALLLEQLDSTIRSVEDAEALGITVLGVLPRIDDGAAIAPVKYGRRRRRVQAEMFANRDLVVHTHPKSSVAECCRTIRTNLMFMSAETPRKTLVVTSPNPREGKTTIAVSIATSLAQSGKRVLLVDTDLRKPRLHRSFDKTLERGITTVLLGEHTLAEAVHETEIARLDFLAAGPIPPNPSELLHTSQFKALLAEMAGLYDQIIFDSPPLAAVADAAVLAPQVDGAIVVVHGQKTSRDALRSALRQLRSVGSHVVGGVLNDVDLSAGAYGYYQAGSYYMEEQHDPGDGGGPGPNGRGPTAPRPVADA